MSGYPCGFQLDVVRLRRLAKHIEIEFVRT